MKHIKVKFVDYWPNHHLEEDILYRWLQTHYDVELTDEPDYIIYSCFGCEHLLYDGIRIFYTAENVAPDFNECDYALSFEKMSFGDRHMRLPNFFKYTREIQLIQEEHISGITERLADRKFCSYVVSNGNGDPIREQFFHRLSEYKQVDSGGRFLNNIGMTVKDKISFQAAYKFSIAFENRSHPGYTTEKILQAFASRTIPIYWGDPYVSDYFNSRAFICLTDLKSQDQVLEQIQLLDENSELYLRMLRESPWARQTIYDEKMSELNDFLQHIFEQSPERAYRRGKSAIYAQYTNNILTWKHFYETQRKGNTRSAIQKVKNRIALFKGKG